MKNQFPESQYLFVGKILDQELAKYLKENGAEVKDAIPHEEIANIMNDYEYFYYTPEIYDSFCLKILEADLCGMKIFADTPRIGIFSYNKPLKELVDMMNMFHITLWY